MAGTAQPQPTTEQKVMASIGAITTVTEGILATFGHDSVASAVGEFATLAPVFGGLFDAIRGLFHHGQPKQAGAATAPVSPTSL